MDRQKGPVLSVGTPEAESIKITHLEELQQKFVRACPLKTPDILINARKVFDCIIVWNYVEVLLSNFSVEFVATDGVKFRV